MNTNDFKNRFAAGERDFSLEDLQKVDLTWTDLQQVSFEGANLSHSNLLKANLSQANLQNANLSFANLSGANLTESNIQGAVLEGANLNDVTWTAVLYDTTTRFPHGITVEFIEAERQKNNKLPSSSENRPSLNPSGLLKQVQSLNPANLVNQAKGAVTQAAQTLKSTAQDFLPAQDLAAPSDEEDILVAEIIEEEMPPHSSQLAILETPTKPQNHQVWQQLASLKSLGHQKLAFSSDSKLLAMGQTDSSLAVWQVGYQECQFWYSFLGQQNGIYGIAFSPDNSLIASGAGDGKITIWRLENKSLLTTFTPSRYRTDEAAHNQKLFQAYNPGIFVHGYRAAVSAIAFSPKGDRIIAGYADGHLRLWDINQGRCLKEQKLHDGPIVQVKYSENGKLIITSSIDKSLKVILSDLWKPCHVHRFDHGWPSDCVITPDHQFAIAGLNNGHIHAWNLAQDKLQYHLTASHQPGLMNLHLSTDTTLMSTSQDQQLKFWHWQTGEALGSQSGSYPACISSDRKTLAVTANRNQIQLLQKIP